MAERRSKAGYILPDPPAKCPQRIKRKGPQGYVWEPCGHKATQTLPDGRKLCLRHHTAWCEEEAKRQETERESDRAAALWKEMSAKALQLRQRYLIDVTIEVVETRYGIQMPTGKMIIDPDDLLRDLALSKGKRPTGVKAVS